MNINIKPAVYNFTHKTENLTVQFDFDTVPSPRLIKFGFNYESEKLDVVRLMSNPHYIAGLKFDIDRTSQWKNVKGDLQLFCTYWEIISLFGIFNKSLTMTTTNESIFKQIEIQNQKVFNSKTNITFSKLHDKQIVDLVFHTVSPIDIEENAYIHLLLQDLPAIFKKQKRGSILILQIFGTYTNVMVQLIYYLSSLYENTFCMKPCVISDLSDEKYLIFSGLVTNVKDWPEPSSDSFLNDLHLNPGLIIDKIQCMNGDAIADKFETYDTIKKYLDNKIFDGFRQKELLQRQDINMVAWFNLFLDKKKLEPLLEEIIKQTDAECNWKL